MAHPALSIRVADECFEDYILNSEFTFTVLGYAQPIIGECVDSWPVELVEPYSKNYGIDSQEFADHRDAATSSVMVAWLDDHPVGHIVMSTHWSGFAYIDELAVDESARVMASHVHCSMPRNSGLASAVCRVSFWKRRTIIWEPAGCTRVAGTWSAGWITCAIEALIRTLVKRRSSGI